MGSLEDFARLFLDDPPPMCLPAMPSAQIQRDWTGNDGAALMNQSLAFVNSVVSKYTVIIGRQIRGANLLDYGAGWGRLTRLFMYYSPNIRACDAWQISVDLFNSLGFLQRCDLIEAKPTTLPYDSNSFDLVWAFSIFTHLSLDAADAVMSAVHRVTKTRGIFAITIRPGGYWDLLRGERDHLMSEHDRNGFAHVCHDGRQDYGETSMTTRFITERWPMWHVADTQINNADPHQQIVFLQKR